MAAAPFSDERHTGDAIDSKTKSCLVKVGLPVDDPCSETFWKVSDNGSNMVKGWSGLPGGFCTAHTTKLSSNVFLKEPEVAVVVSDLKYHTQHLHQCLMGMSDFHEYQEQLKLPIKKPQSTGVLW